MTTRPGVKPGGVGERYAVRCSAATLTNVPAFSLLDMSPYMTGSFPAPCSGTNQCAYVRLPRIQAAFEFALPELGPQMRRDDYAKRVDTRCRVSVQIER